MRCKTWIRSVAPYVALCLLLSGCGKDEGAAPVVNVGPPPTAEEGQEYGNALEAAVAAGDAAKVTDLLGVGPIVERLLVEKKTPTAERKSFMRGFEGSGKQQFSKVLIAQAAAKDGEYKYVRTIERNGEQHVIMRLTLGEGGFNYHEIYLSRRADGAIVARDLYIVAFGQTLSEMMGSLIGAALRDVPVEMAEFAKDVREGRSELALANFRRMPPKLRQNKSLLLMAVMAANQVQESDYLQLMKEFRDRFPGDAAADMVSIDYHFLRKEYDELLGCVDRLDKFVGGDPELGCRRGEFLIVAERFADAQVAVDKSLQEYPKYVPLHWTAIAVSLHRKDHADALSRLKTIHEVCGVELDEQALRQEDYEDFGKSPQYQKFLEWYRARNQEKSCP